MKKIIMGLMGLVFLLSLSQTAFAKSYEGKKILYIDSYHEGYAWSDGITAGIKKVLKKTGVNLKIFRMDTKRNPDETFKKAAASKAREEINHFKPDVVIASDDNASKYLIMPYYKNAELPFVFCGVNWDASVYNYPYENATGMVEVALIPQLIEQLKLWAKGDKIGYLGPETLTTHKEAEAYRKTFGLEFAEYYAKDYKDWKKGFLEIQKKVDMLLIASDGGLYKDFQHEFQTFVESNTTIPTGTCYDFMMPVSLVGVLKVAKEQGEWSARTALKIIDGTSPSDIPIVQNKKAKMAINKKIGTAMGIDMSIFPKM
jgi:ABC-type uncharacterized transport system substrate-binding protein